MIRKLLANLLSLAICLLILSINVLTQERVIPESKRQLIAELIVVMKMDTQLEKMTDTILKGMQSTYSIGFNVAVDQLKNVTEVEKNQIKETGVDRFVEFSEKFRKRLPEVVDYRKYIEDSIYPIYHKFYSESELRDLITFYRTPTGQKVIDTMPDLLAESQAIAAEKFVPQLIPLIEELTREQIEKAAPPKPKRKAN